MTGFRRAFSIAPFPFPCTPILLCALAVGALAQQSPRAGLNDPGTLEDFSVSYRTAPGTGVLLLTVSAEKSGVRMDRQALVKVVRSSDQSATWHTTEDTSRAVFTDLPYGSYLVEVNAVGYLGAENQVQIMLSPGPKLMEVILHRDPSAINLDVADSVIAAKARKEAKHAVSLLKSGKLVDAEKHLETAYKIAPSSSDLNFLLGYLYFQKKDYTQSRTYLGTATNLSPTNAQALTLLGRTGLEIEDYPSARSALERAVLADSENWLPHNLLADAYLHERNYGKAREEAQIALTKGQRSGKTASSPAQLVLGQALVGLGQDREGIQALDVFLKQSPTHPLAPQVRSMIDQIEKRGSTTPSVASPAPAEVALSGVDPLSAMPELDLSTQTWRPPGVDDVRPTLASGVACPAAEVMEQSGKRVEELVADISRFAAIEDLFHQSLDNFGFPTRTETRKYDYVAAISEPVPGTVSILEYRSDKLTVQSYPDQIASTGFATLALVFHPEMRPDFDLQCEGLGEWHGEPTWLVHFQQRTDRPNRMHTYKIGEQVVPVGLKGRAWITANRFQIIRMEADIVKPMPEIRLLSEHQVVEYGPVPFPKKNTTLWLPKNAEIYFDFRKHRYYRRHSFDHYMLFSIDADEKRKEPTPKNVPQQPSDGKASSFVQRLSRSLQTTLQFSSSPTKTPTV